MERAALDQIVLRRKVAKKTHNNATLTREELQQQMDEFFARKGHVREIPSGVSGGQNGILQPSDEPGASMAVIRPSKNLPEKQSRKKPAEKKPKIDLTEGGIFVNQKEAADMIGLTSSYLGTLVGRGLIKLTLAKRVHGKNFYRRSEVLALPPYEKTGHYTGKNK